MRLRMANSLGGTPGGAVASCAFARSAYAMSSLHLRRKRAASALSAASLAARMYSSAARMAWSRASWPLDDATRDSAACSGGQVQNKIPGLQDEASGNGSSGYGPYLGTPLHASLVVLSLGHGAYGGVLRD